MLLWDSELHWRVSQSVKSRSPRSVLDRSHADFSGRARHPSVCFPSSITRFYFQDLNILLFFFLDLPDFADTATNNISLCFACFFLHDCENILIIVRFIFCQLIFLHGFLLTEFPSVSRFYSLLREVLRHQLPSCSRLLCCCPMNKRVVHLAAFDFPSIISSRALSGQLVMWPDDQH